MRVHKNFLETSGQDKIHVDEIAVAPGLLLGGAVIVESGSNANGEYVRWGNGLQVCWGKKSFTLPPTTHSSSTGLYLVHGSYSDALTITYPKSFKEVTYFSAKLHANETINVSNRIMASTYCNMGLATSANMEGMIKDFYYLVAGWWK